MKISLVINTYNQPEALDKVLGAVCAQSCLPAEILIADDGSTAETKELIARRAESSPVPLQHVWQEKAGFRRSRILNRCIERSSGDYLVFLDGDSVPNRHFVRDHIALAEKGFWVQGRRAFVKEPYVGGFSPRLGCVLRYALLGRLTGLGKVFRLPFPLVQRNTDMHGILGCNLGIWREDLIAVNGYDESFEGWGKEDSELGARLYHLGRVRKMVRGQAVIFHLNHPLLPRDNLKRNEAHLERTLRERTVRCKNGIVRDAAATAEPSPSPSA